MNENSTLVVDVPEIPPEAVEFAKAMAILVEKHGIHTATMDVRIDTYDRGVQQDVKVYVSLKDNRGRPRTKVQITAQVNVRVDVVNEPDSTS